MKQSLADQYLRRVGVKPLIRPTRNQAEIDLLPPYGDPEVNLAGEFSTYLLVGAALTTLLDRLGER